MNEQLNNALADILIKATKTAESAQEFVMAEMPEVVNQLLWWHGVKSFIFFSSIFLFVGLAVKVRQLISSAEATPKEDRPDWYFDDINFRDSPSVFAQGQWVWIICLLGISSLVFIRNLAWLQILIAPKLYLVEYAAALVK